MSGPRLSARDGAADSRWQSTSIELRSGTVIESFGTGQRIRGRRRREHRPTLIVCDDLQNDSHISSAAQREATRRWFHGTLVKAGTKEDEHRQPGDRAASRCAGFGTASFAGLDQRAVCGDRELADES